jgi:hypothetical protein
MSEATSLARMSGVFGAARSVACSAVELFGPSHRGRTPETPSLPTPQPPIPPEPVPPPQPEPPPEPVPPPQPEPLPEGVEDIAAQDSHARDQADR